MTWSFCFNVI